MPEEGGGIKRCVLQVVRDGIKLNFSVVNFSIIMGLHRETSCVARLRLVSTHLLSPARRAPCGFAFVEFHLQAEALASMRYISGTKLDERVIRCDLDPGFKEGRQFGRGKSGGQVRDEYREEYDGGRGRSRV